MCDVGGFVEDTWNDLGDSGQDLIDTGKDVVSGAGDTAESLLKETARIPQNVINTVEDIGQGVGKVVSGIGQAAENILHDPLPLIETIALTYMLGPEGFALASESMSAAIANSAVSAANGGRMEDIALAAASAYAGATIGGEVAGALPAGTDKVIKQVVASSSGSAATAALRGGNLETVLASGAAGAVSSYVSQSLKQQGYTRLDNRLVTNTVNAATKAILQGKDVTEAITNSVTATAIQAAISGRADQLNKNNEIGTSIANQASNLATKGQEFWNSMVTPAENSVKTQYDQAIKDQQAYVTAKSQFDEIYKTYSDNKAAYETDPSNTTAYEAANAAALKANEIAPTLKALGETAVASSDAYNTTAGNYTTVKQQFESTYTAPLTDLNAKIADLNAQNTSLAAANGQDVVKYQNELQKNADELAKSISSETTANALEKFGLPDAPTSFKTDADGNPVITVYAERLPEADSLVALDAGKLPDFAGTVPSKVGYTTDANGNPVITVTADRLPEADSLLTLDAESLPQDPTKTPAVTTQPAGAPAAPKTTGGADTTDKINPQIQIVPIVDKYIAALNPSLQKTSAPIDSSQTPTEDGTISGTASTSPKATWLGGIKKASSMYDPLSAALPDPFSFLNTPNSAADQSPASSFFSYGLVTSPTDTLLGGTTPTSALQTATSVHPDYPSLPTSTVPTYAQGGEVMYSPLMTASGGNVPHKGSHYVQGAGGGQDDLVDAKLADGEYVFDAEIVSALGDGSNKEGARKLDAMREAIRRHKRSAPLNTIPPKAKSPLAYLKGVK